MTTPERIEDIKDRIRMLILAETNNEKAAEALEEIEEFAGDKAVALYEQMNAEQEIDTPE